MRSYITTLLFCFALIQMHAQTDGLSDEQAINNAISKLSAATEPNGEGADAYDAILAEEFTRWTIGEEELYTKEDWIKGMKYL